MTNHKVLIITATGPGKLVQPILTNVSRVNFQLDKKIIQISQEEGTNVKEFDAAYIGLVQFTNTNGNYYIEIYSS